MNDKRKRIIQYAKAIIDLGYQVYLSNSDTAHYGYVVNEKDEIGDFHLDDFGIGLCFSTKHIGCKEYVSGFGLDDRWNGHTEITKELVDRAFMHHPDWVKKDLDKIKKWTATSYFAKNPGYRNNVFNLNEICEAL